MMELMIMIMMFKLLMKILTFQLGQVLLSTVQFNFDDVTGTSRLSWDRRFAVDGGAVPFYQFGTAVVCNCLRPQCATCHADRL